MQIPAQGQLLLMHDCRVKAVEPTSVALWELLFREVYFGFGSAPNLVSTPAMEPPGTNSRKMFMYSSFRSLPCSTQRPNHHIELSSSYPAMHTLCRPDAAGPRSWRSLCGHALATN
jgi:hypothetical protein